MASSPNDDHYPYLMSLNLDEFIIGKPNLDHESLIKNMAISVEEENRLKMQNPNLSFSSSSSSSSSPTIIHENPNTESAHSAANDVWNDQMRNPMNYVMQNDGILGDIQEDFLQNPLPLMTKIDQEYMKWQQQEMMDSSSHFRVFENGFDENKVSTTQVVGNSSDSRVEIGRDINDLKDVKMVKSVERRQKRMIKNRESAARSRARKQDYINQLQHKVSQLQTANKLLKKRKEAYALLNLSGPRYQLRRTSSAHF